MHGHDKTEGKEERGNGGGSIQTVIIDLEYFFLEKLAETKIKTE